LDKKKEMEKYKWKHPILDIMKIGIAVAPGWWVIVCLYTIISAAIPIVNIMCVAKFIENVIAYVKGEADYNNVFFMAFLVVVIIAFQWVSGTVMRLVWIRIENKLRITFGVDIIEKRAKLEYEYIENEETWDLIKRVANQPETKVREWFETCISFLTLLFRVIGIVLVLSMYVWWEGILLVAVSIPLMYLAIKSGNATYEARQEVTECSRKCEYLTDLVLGREPVLERTIFNYGDFVDGKWEKEYGIMAKMLLKAYGTWYLKLEMGSIFTAITMTLAIVAMLIPTIKGFIPIGMFMSLTNSSMALIESMAWEFRGYVDKITKLYNYFKEVKKVALLNEKKDALKDRNTHMEFESIEFEDVAFAYPNTDRNVLEHISFKIKKGVHYAIVGKNGEGKSTIIKLLSGLYSDYSGRILINGKELREHKYEDLRGLFSIVYQDYGKYAISVKDNLKLSNSEVTDERMNETLRLFELDSVVPELPNGIDHPLGKIQASGVDLSGGEWQRVALSRAYINNAPIYLLDEPTASLDPLSESQVYQDFQKASANKTTILISHRLGSVKLADEIMVLDQGKIVEVGSHEKLMENKQLYFEMYECQRSWYK
jgi:ABC-type multidrug transport system fused ATPase/permease subunit